MLIYPAIDLFGGQAVRLLKGDYARMTVYNPNPVAVATDFAARGATHMHVVDLEGARAGDTPHLALIARLKADSGLFMEVGGGIRSLETIARYLEEALVDRVILGTAAVTDQSLLDSALARWGKRIAVGVDIRDGVVAIRGWTEQSGLDAFAFIRRMEEIGVTTAIVTDISRDGVMRGANRDLYRRMSEELGLNLIASGGVSSLGDITALRALGLHGAIVGKAYYTGALRLEDAIREGGAV